MSKELPQHFMDEYQQKAIDMAMRGHNILLTGCAGSGLSKLSGEILSHPRARPTELHWKDLTLSKLSVDMLSLPCARPAELYRKDSDELCVDTSAQVLRQDALLSI